jgi:hypothetical protein
MYTCLTVCRALPVFDRYTHRLYDVVPLSDAQNLPPLILVTMRAAGYTFIVVEEGKGPDYTDNRFCGVCGDWCSIEDGTKYVYLYFLDIYINILFCIDSCGVCEDIFHLSCVNLLRKPSKGYVWECVECQRRAFGAPQENTCAALNSIAPRVEPLSISHMNQVVSSSTSPAITATKSCFDSPMDSTSSDSLGESGPAGRTFRKRGVREEISAVNAVSAVSSEDHLPLNVNKSNSAAAGPLTSSSSSISSFSASLEDLVSVLDSDGIATLEAVKRSGIRRVWPFRYYDSSFKPTDLEGLSLCIYECLLNVDSLQDPHDEGCPRSSSR